MKKEGIDYIFEKNPELANEIYGILGFRENYGGIKVELGRSKEVKDALGKKALIQNINVLYKEKVLMDQDHAIHNLTLQIFPDLNEAIVGNLFMPKNFRGRKLTKHIYQAVADKLGTPLVDSLNRRDRLGEYYNQSESGSRIWRKRKSFDPTKITFSQEEKAKEIYTKYRETTEEEMGSQKDIKGFQQFVKNQKGDSLEKKLVSGIFLAFVIAGLFFSTSSSTGNFIGTNILSSNFTGFLLFIIGIVGFLFHRKYGERR